VKFKDHFSRQAADYALFRPRYPRALFAFIAANSPNDKNALDCATGNGQAAIGLVQFFQNVIAIDASAAQIENAQPGHRVEYRVAPAEASGLLASSCDAITVAQALHWFRFEEFYAEARRVLKPDGLLAVWADAASRVLHSAGTVTLIWRADGLGDVLGALAERFGGTAVLPVYGRAGQPAIRVLVCARKGSRAPLVLLPGLTLNAEDGSPTAEAEAILRGAEALPMTER